MDDIRALWPDDEWFAVGSGMGGSFEGREKLAELLKKGLMSLGRCDIFRS